MFGNVGYEIFKANRAKFDWSKWKGDHGGDNLVESMHPVFVARGPAFKQNYSTTIDMKVHSVDVYSLMCFILNIEPGENNGTFTIIKSLINENYYQKRVELKTLNYIKSLFVKSFKFDSLVEEFNMITKLNQNGNLYVVFLIFILICFILIIQLWTSHNIASKCLLSPNVFLKRNYKFIESI